MTLRRRKPVGILKTALEAQGIDVPYKDGRIDSKKLLEFAEDSAGLDNSDSSLKYHERVALVANELDLNGMEGVPAEAPAPAGAAAPAPAAAAAAAPSPPAAAAAPLLPTPAPAAPSSLAGIMPSTQQRMEYAHKSRVDQLLATDAGNLG